MIERIQLGPDGPGISSIVYGTWRFREDAEGHGPDRLQRKVEACLEAGMTTLDFADIYGDYTCHEAFGGLFRQAPNLRGQVEIVTKCGIIAPCGRWSGEPVKAYRATRQHIVASVDEALRELAVDKIDVLLIHRPDWLTPAEETAAGLEAVVGSGKVGHAGVSNYSPAQFDLLRSLLSFSLVTNQVELSLYRMAPLTDGILTQAQAHRFHPMAWSPSGGGRLFHGDDAASQRLRATMTEMAPRYDHATADQLALAWIMALPSGPIPILGTNQIERIHSGAQATGIRLEREDWYRLWQAAAGEEVP